MSTVARIVKRRTAQGGKTSRDDNEELMNGICERFFFILITSSSSTFSLHFHFHFAIYFSVVHTRKLFEGKCGKFQRRE
jgi:hypothetical protein